VAAVAHIAIINPRFEQSYWGLEHALPLFRKRANLPVASLPLLAALTPPEHTVTLHDENVTPLNFEAIAKVDIVGVTGMSVQRFRMREIMQELKQRGAFVVVGGPWVSVKEDYFGELADVVFVGEAEDTWPQFLTEWQQGRHEKRYEQLEKTDMTRVPCPRYDQIDARHYMFGSMQISRGCPFQCEFCDIIITFGRRPRLKTIAQVIAEFEALWKNGMEIVFIVDDNLIGNKVAIKPLLAEIVAWQRMNAYPLTFFTEASLDLADDPELLQLMADANIQSVFVGVESPNESSLRETKKYQNVRSGATIVERIHRIQDAGLDVWCGMIVGFDSDDAKVFDAQRDFLRESRIVHAMIGMLSAIPKTPLYKRLAEEGRLDESDELEFGTNIIPAQMTRAELRDGYVRLMHELYEPNAYFERLDRHFVHDRFCFGQSRVAYWRTHRWSWLKGESVHLARSAVLYWQLMRGVPDKALRREYRRRISRLLRIRHDPVVLFVYILKCAMHYHHFTMARKMSREKSAIVNSI
jgi:radical SAM superfamily enzyme YgiQ (UPF0313 family)